MVLVSNITYTNSKNLKEKKKGNSVNTYDSFSGSTGVLRYTLSHQNNFLKKALKNRVHSNIITTKQIFIIQTKKVFNH